MKIYATLLHSDHESATLQFNFEGGVSRDVRLHRGLSVNIVPNDKRTVQVPTTPSRGTITPPALKRVPISAMPTLDHLDV